MTEIHIENPPLRLECSVKVATGREDNILAFGQLRAFTEKDGTAFFKVSGFTLRRKDFKKSSKPVLSVTFPAYKAAMRYYTSFYLPDKQLYRNVVKAFTQEYEAESGEDISQYDIDYTEQDHFTDQELERISKEVDLMK